MPDFPQLPHAAGASGPLRDRAIQQVPFASREGRQYGGGNRFWHLRGFHVFRMHAVHFHPRPGPVTKGLTKTEFWSRPFLDAARLTDVRPSDFLAGLG